MKPFFLVFFKIDHSILIFEELLNKLYMENDQIDLWDFFKHNFKHMKNCPVRVQKEACVALSSTLQRTLGFSERTAKNFVILLFSVFSIFLFKSEGILLIFNTIILHWPSETRPVSIIDKQLWAFSFSQSVLHWLANRSGVETDKIRNKRDTHGRKREDELGEGTENCP